MIKPQPYKVTCNQCAWTQLFAPVSDVILPTVDPSAAQAVNQKILVIAI